MSSKQSCFKAILKSDFKRMWWVGILSTVLMFMTTVSGFINLYGRVYNENNWTIEKHNVINNLSTLMIIGIPIAFLLGHVVFSYLNNTSSVTFLHSLPCTRNELFFAHTTFSLITIIIPAILSYLVCMSVVDSGVDPLWLLESFFYYLVYTLIIYAISTVVAMLCGSSIASGIFTLVVLYFPLYVFSFYRTACEEYLFGYGERYAYDFADHWLGQYVYLGFEQLASWRCIIYIFLIVFCACLSLFLYKKRHLENYGEVVAFTQLGGTFKVVFGLCFGILAFFYFGAFHNDVNLIYLCIFAPVGTIIANMLINRSFTFKKILVPVIVSISIALVIFFGFVIDFTGYETRVPSVDEVESITFEEGYNRWNYMENENGDFEEVLLPKPVCKDKKVIEEIIAFHSEFVNDRNNQNRNSYYYSIDIEYNLKNGKTIYRTYAVDLLNYNKLQNIWFTTNVAKNWFYPIFDEEAEFKYYYVSVYDYKSHTNLFDRSDKEFMLGLIDAIKKDKANITYAEYKDKQKGNRDYDIDFDCQRVYTINGKKYFDDMTLTFMITKNDVNTMNFLIENGLEEAKLAAGNKPLEQVEKYKMLDEDIEIYD